MEGKTEARMDWLGFGLQVLPATALAALATLLGSEILAARTPLSWQFPLVIGGLVLFVGLLTFRSWGGWSLAMLVGFALLAGTVLGGLLAGSSGSWPLAWLMSALLLAIAATISGFLPPWLLRMGFGLWLASLVYLIGWIGFAALNLPTGSQVAWALAGAMIFALLGAIWFASLNPERGATASSLAVDLYILAFNLTIALRVLASI
jgi:hypothetical protein